MRTVAGKSNIEIVMALRPIGLASIMVQLCNVVKLTWVHTVRLHIIKHTAVSNVRTQVVLDNL